MSMLELTDYAERNIVDRMSTVPGVASVGIIGGRRYSMRIWIDRQALAARQLTVADIENALRRENVQLPAGRLESRTREFSLRTMVGLETRGGLPQPRHRARRRRPPRAARRSRGGAARRRGRAHVHPRSNGAPGLGMQVRGAIEGQHARHRARRARGDRADQATPADRHDARTSASTTPCRSRRRCAKC